MKTSYQIPAFLKYNAVAVIATSVDFFLLIFLTEIMDLWYLFSAVFGAVAGGITSFILERNWAFSNSEGLLQHQAIKYLIIWFTSILLNTSLLYLFVDFFLLQYIISKVIVAVLVGIGFNYFTHKYFIFK